MREQEIETETETDRACLSLEELAEEQSVSHAETARHLERCPRCRARLILLSHAPIDGSVAPLDPASLPAPEVPHRQMAKVSSETELAAGVICSVASDLAPGERMLGVVLSEGEDQHEDGHLHVLTLAPISTEILSAANWDFRVAPDDSPLGYRYMVETWNYGRVSRAQLEETFGQLNHNKWLELKRLWEANLSGGDAPEDMEETGPPILGPKDPRVDFQRDEAARSQVFYQPWATHVDSLGGPFITDVRRRLRSMGTNVVEVAREAGVNEHLVVCALGSGFTHRPNASELGRLSLYVGIDFTINGVREALREEASTLWLRDSDGLLLSDAARQPSTRLSSVVDLWKRTIGGGAKRNDDLDDYIDEVVAAASSFRPLSESS